MKDENTNQKPFRVLSLDGGGIRGVYTASYLNYLCVQLAKKRGEFDLDLGKGFDLIVGTSTGAIVGSALAAGISLTRVVDLFQTQAKSIFPHQIKGSFSTIFRAFTKGYFVRKGDKALRKALQCELGDLTLADIFNKRGISMSIPTVVMSNYQALVFKKTATSGVRDDNYSLVDICLASSAAPIYRSLAAVKKPDSNSEVEQIFADGGLWANNPILVALLDAIQITDCKRPIELFSLGTCSRPEGEHINPKKVHRSLLGWLFGAKIIPLSISAQEFAFDNMARLFSIQFQKLGCDLKVIRFPRNDVPAKMMEFLSLDENTTKGNRNAYFAS